MIGLGALGVLFGQRLMANGADVLVLADKGFVSLDVEYVDGTKIESKANKYTFVWRKTVERNTV